MNLLVDTDGKICLYNSKESHKIAKLILENTHKSYKISYFNKHLISSTQEFIVFVCEKYPERKEKLNLIDLINFQNQKNTSVLKEYASRNLDFSNYYQNFLTENITPKKSYILTFRIKELLLKCYPQMIMANKKGMSLNKIMSKYKMDNLPNFESSKII